MNLQTMEYISALARERSFTCAAEDDSVFRDCPFLLGSRAQDIAGFAAQQALRSIGAPLRVRARSDNADTMITLCEHGCGVYFCSELLLRALCALGRVGLRPSIVAGFVFVLVSIARIIVIDQADKFQNLAEAAALFARHMHKPPVSIVVDLRPAI